MGIRMISFLLSGGIILFLLGLQMFFGYQSQNTKKESDHDIAVFPLAIPATTTPAAILAVILRTDNNLYPISQQAVTAGLTHLHPVDHTSLATLIESNYQANRLWWRVILTRIMGMILAAFSVEIVMDALGADR